MFIRTTLVTLLIVFMTTLANAQYPYSDPYAARANGYAVRQTQLASQRAQASVPVNYAFPVRRDLTAVYGLGTYPSAYGQSNTPYVNTSLVNGGNVAYRPTANNTNLCSSRYGNSTAYSSYPPQTAAAAVGAARPYYVGTSFAGPPKVYPRDQPIRNFFRYFAQ